MANVPGAIKHLPSLHNPLLNAIFNNPFHATGPTKHTIRELGEKHSDYAVLVPPAHVLHQKLNNSRGKLGDHCYNDDEFLRSHIINTADPLAVSTALLSKSQLVIYVTMSGKQVLLKGGMILTGKNFKKSICLRILHISEFASFCEYFPKGSRFLLIFIEDSLLFDKQEPQQIDLKEKRFSSNDLNGDRKKEISFEDVLRSFPLLSKSMSQQFYSLFHHNNRKSERLRTKQTMTIQEIENEFRLFESEVFSIIQTCINSGTTEGERIYAILDSVATKHPQVDMNQLIHEYVELNMYDKIWLQIVFQLDNTASTEDSKSRSKGKVLTTSLYKDLSCLSLNQLDVPVEDPWHLNILQSRIAESISILSKLQTREVLNQRQKVAIIEKAINVLTTNTGELSRNIVIDADTFIGLLIMVVVHSKIPDLEAHLMYIRHFGSPSSSERGKETSEQKSLGYLNYILSNFDAVIYLLSSTEEISEENHLANLIEASASNYRFWYAIKTENIRELRSILSVVEESCGTKPLSKSHFLRSKNIHGESCFNFAIKTKNIEVFRIILTQTASWILLEDVVFDKNTSTDQNLLMIALQEDAHQISLDIITLLEESASSQERFMYYNSKDSNGRTVGHYLSHNLDALDRMANLIDWSIKDNSSQTPLMALCRCYDQSNYKDLVQMVFKHIFNQSHHVLTFDEHIDRAGNTILHALARGIPESNLFSSDRALVNINQFNSKQLTPMSLFVRYNRIENLKAVLQEKTLVFDVEDPKLFYNVLDYYSFSAGKQYAGSSIEFQSVQKLILEKFFEINFSSSGSRFFGLVNSRFDAALNDWAVNVAYLNTDKTKCIETKYVPLEKLYQFYYFHKRLSQIHFMPQPKVLSENFIKRKSTVQTYSKFRLNRCMEYLNTFISSSHFLEDAARQQLHQGFHQFLIRDQAADEYLKNVGKSAKQLKETESSIILTQAKISEIVFFIDYSLQRIKHYLLVMKKLRILFANGTIKQCEKRYFIDRLLALLGTMPTSEASAELELRDIDGPYRTIGPFCLWLELCTDELHNNCEALMNKISRWKVSYNKIRELNKELLILEEQLMVIQEPENGDNPEFSGQRPQLIRKSTLHVEPNLEIKEEASFFNFGLVDNKKTKYKKLLLLKADSVASLLELNQEIKVEHEQIATSISRFLPFRSKYFSFGLKRVAQSTLTLMRVRLFELKKIQHEVKKSFLKI